MKNPTTSLSAKDLSESQNIKLSANSFWFLFPLKYTAVYNLSYYHTPLTTSTNDLAFTLPLPQSTEIFVISTDEQTAGRGQGENRWEAEIGKNLTFSFVCRSEFLKPTEQFVVLQAASLAVRHVLAKICNNVTIKWPNDIYIGDNKVSGTLIQCDLEHENIRRIVIGIGINVNQRKFVSDAPNPISLFNATNQEYDREKLLHAISERFAMEYEALRYNRDCVKQRYVSHLYRNTGMHSYSDKHGTFNAEFVKIENNGHLVLRDDKGNIREYAFREVEFK